MRCLKYSLIFRAKAGEIINVEKAPVVDVVGGDPPVGQAKGLRFDQFVQFLKTCRIRRVSIDQFDSSSYTSGDFSRPRA